MEACVKYWLGRINLYVSKAKYFGGRFYPVMRRGAYVFLTVFMICSLPLFISACDREFPYSGEHMDLAAATIFSIPGTDSNAMDSFMILEQDPYGRILYAASLANSKLSRVSNSEDAAFPPVFAVLIIQKTDDEHVYFYGESNYLLRIVSERLDISETTVEYHFSKDELNDLKEANDWGEPIEDCDRVSVKVPVVVQKEDGRPLSTDAVLTQKIGSNNRPEFFRKDASGNKVYFVLNIDQSYSTKETTYQWYFVIFDEQWQLANDENGIWKVRDADAMSEELKTFLHTNGWNDVIG